MMSFSVVSWIRSDHHWERSTKLREDKLELISPSCVVFDSSTLLKELVIATLHLGRRNFLDAVANVPSVTERVANTSRSLTIKLILQLDFDLRPRFDSAFNCPVGIGDVQMNGD